MALSVDNQTKLIDAICSVLGKLASLLGAAEKAIEKEISDK